MRGRTAAARADDGRAERAHAAGVLGHDFGRAVVDRPAIDHVGHAGVAFSDQRQGGAGLAHAIDYALDLGGAVAAVAAQRGQVQIGQFLNRLRRADAHHGEAARVEGHGGDDRQLRGGLTRANDGGAHFLQIAHRFDPQHIDAASRQTRRLSGKASHRRVKGQRAHWLEQLAARANRASHDRVFASFGARQLGSGPVQLKHAILQVVQLQAKRGATKAIRQNNLRASVQVAAVYGAHVRLLVGQHIPLLGRVAKHQAGVHQHGAHAAVGHDRLAASDQFKKAIGHE